MLFRVLLVEDNDTDAELICRQLARSHPDSKIHRVQTEAEFLLALKEIKPHLILSDFSLPQFNGLRALELACARADQTPFILVSGTANVREAREVLSRGASEYVRKSELSGLGAAIDRALTASQADDPDLPTGD
jgi:CheY-like chemotaxis protein